MPTSLSGREYFIETLEPFRNVVDHRVNRTGAAVFLGNHRGCRVIVAFDHDDHAEVRVYEQFGFGSNTFRTVKIPHGQARGWSELSARNNHRPTAYVVVKKE